MLSDPPTETSTTDTIASQQAEIERLTALLRAAEVKESSFSNAQLAEQTVATLVESIVRNLGRSGTPIGASKSAKILDPPLLTDGKEPTFESWKLQI